MKENNSIYDELAEMDMLKERLKENQNQVLDVYDPDDEKLTALLVEMNDLMIEVEQVESEMQELMKQL